MRARFKRWWRRFNRSPYLRDLRIIRPQYRHLYRDRLNNGDLGWALNALFDAYRAGHLRDTQRPHGVREMGNDTQRGRDRAIAARMEHAVLYNQDEVFKVLAFVNRHLLVAAMNAFVTDRTPGDFPCK